MTNWYLTRGFRFAGVQSGLRSEPNRRDLALVVSGVPATEEDCL
jgi:glutamate N-acetyltransferase/amino-acid N-acetyltransferase